jgi:predicted ribonuclease YlaK
MTKHSQVLDTNILLRGKGETGIIVYPVLCELDKLKTFSAEVGKDARDAISKIYFHPELYVMDSGQKKESETVDDYLVDFCSERGLTLRTLDLSLYLKAKTRGVKVVFDEHSESKAYSGISYLKDLPDDVVVAICEGQELDAVRFPENHYFISDTHVYRVVGQVPRLVKHPSFQSRACGSIRPRNPEQIALMDLVGDETVSVVSAAGGFGTGEITPL